MTSRRTLADWTQQLSLIEEGTQGPHQRCPSPRPLIQLNVAFWMIERIRVEGRGWVLQWCSCLWLAQTPPWVTPELSGSPRCLEWGLFLGLSELSTSEKNRCFFPFPQENLSSRHHNSYLENPNRNSSLAVTWSIDLPRPSPFLKAMFIFPELKLRLCCVIQE